MTTTTFSTAVCCNPDVYYSPADYLNDVVHSYRNAITKKGNIVARLATHKALTDRLYDRSVIKGCAAELNNLYLDDIAGVCVSKELERKARSTYNIACLIYFLSEMNITVLLAALLPSTDCSAIVGFSGITALDYLEGKLMHKKLKIRDHFTEMDLNHLQCYREVVVYMLNNPEAFTIGEGKMRGITGWDENGPSEIMTAILDTVITLLNYVGMNASLQTGEVAPQFQFFHQIDIQLIKGIFDLCESRYDPPIAFDVNGVFDNTFSIRPCPISMNTLGYIYRGYCTVDIQPVILEFARKFNECLTNNHEIGRHIMFISKILRTQLAQYLASISSVKLSTYLAKSDFQMTLPQQYINKYIGIPMLTKISGSHWESLFYGMSVYHDAMEVNRREVFRLLSCELLGITVTR